MLVFVCKRLQMDKLLLSLCEPIIYPVSMNKSLLFIIVLFTVGVNICCGAPQNDIAAFIPKGYVITEKIHGDLNKDHLEDCIIIIKGTDKKRVIKDKNLGELDRNRRGIIVLLKAKNGYVLAAKNYDCFSSENEDGGVYFAPELDISIKAGNLYIHYAHGRYGYWEYTFRYQHADFEFIGYDDSDNRGPVVNSETSINYLTKKKIVKENTNANAETDGEEVFKTTKTTINEIKLIKLSEIKDFDNLTVVGI
jgi:hypothetical protein